MADIIAAPVLLGLAFGRMGCFLNGCCYGGKTSSSLGLRFPGHYAERHPTQLYELLFALVLFVFLRHVFPRWRKHAGTSQTKGDTAREGEVFGYALAMYGVFRFAIEHLRDDPRGALGPLSTSQLISIPVLALGAWLIYRARQDQKFPKR